MSIRTWSSCWDVVTKPQVLIYMDRCLLQTIRASWSLVNEWVVWSREWWLNELFQGCLRCFLQWLHHKNWNVHDNSWHGTHINTCIYELTYSHRYIDIWQSILHIYTWICNIDSDTYSLLEVLLLKLSSSCQFLDRKCCQRSGALAINYTLCVIFVFILCMMLSYERVDRFQHRFQPQ